VRPDFIVELFHKVMSEWELKRKKVYKYELSGKNLIVPWAEHRGGSIVMDLDANFNHIGNRSLKRMPGGDIRWTGYVADFLEKKTKLGGGKFTTEFILLRVLDDKEVGLDNWKPEKDIKKLKILRSTYVTEEEKHWAGRVVGNEFWYFFNWAIIGGLIYYFYNMGFLMKAGPIFIYFLVAVYAFGIFRWGLIRTRKPKQKKIDELLKYKNKLINDFKRKEKENLTRLDKALMHFKTWKKLSPIQFENALKRKLNQLGMNLSGTKTSGDGGIDLEGEDEEKKPILIQVKKYSKPVGVSVVREMIGVRENYQDKPRTIIYSLEGFSKGSIELAASNGIELKSIRKDLLI
jgi:hypothetical protein